VEAFMEDARAQAMLNIECHDEARLIEGALALKHPDEAAGEATPALREALGGVATTGRRYA
jgi:hypothetical protein